MNCFLDTSALLAFLDRDDEHHTEAARLWRTILEEEWQIITSSYVLVECFALCQSRLGLKAAKSLQNDIAPLLNIVWVDAGIHQAAAAAVLAGNKRKVSLVDCASFEVMRRSGLTRAFAFDRHFCDQGFELLS